MRQSLMLFGLAVLSLLAFQWPEWSPIAFDPFIASEKHLGQLIAVTMFFIGCMLPPDEVKQLIRRWPMVISGTAIQYTAMPALAFGLGHLFGLERDILTGVIMVGCVPGAMASNVLTYMARGNISYSVSLTTAATLLSPLIVPWVLMLTLGAERKLDPAAVSYQLFVQVVGPVLTGYFLCRLHKVFERNLVAVGPIVANASILWIIAAVVGINRERLHDATATMLLVLLCVNVLGYCSGFFGGKLMKLPEPMRRALTLEVGMQNAGLGSVLALSLFPENKAVAIPTAAYTFGCMLTGTLLAQYWRGRPVADSEPVAEAAADGAESLS